MTRKPQGIAVLPRLMRAETAAAYVDEKSVEAFLRRVPSVYPSPIVVPGRGKLWRRDDLDLIIDRMGQLTPNLKDASGVL